MVRPIYSAIVAGLTLLKHWGGDCESTFEAMAETIRGCLSLTMSGFAFASHDIGGFEVCSDQHVDERGSDAGSEGLASCRSVHEMAWLRTVFVAFQTSWF